MSSKRRNNNKGRGRTGAKPPSTPAPATGSMEPTLAKLEQAAEAHATETDFDAVAVVPTPPPDTKPEDLVKRAAELVAMLESQRTRVAAEEASAAKRSNEIGELERKLAADRAELQELEGDLDRRDLDVSEREKRLADDEADLLRRREEVVQRELDADAGFSRRNRDALGQLEAEAEALREQFSRHRKQIDDERAAFEHELQERRDQLSAEAKAQREKDTREAAAALEATFAELHTQREEMERLRGDLAVEEKKIRKEKRDLDLERELLAEDRAAFDERVAQRAAQAIEKMAGEIQALNARLDMARAERDRFARLLAEREDADRRFGGETPDEVLKRLRALEGEREQLRKSLGGRPSAEAAQRLEELERQKEFWESDRLQMLGELAEARQEAGRKRIAVTELESLRDQKRSLESANALLH